MFLYWPVILLCPPLPRARTGKRRAGRKRPACHPSPISGKKWFLKFPLFSVTFSTVSSYFNTLGKNISWNYPGFTLTFLHCVTHLYSGKVFWEIHHQSPSQTCSLSHNSTLKLYLYPQAQNCNWTFEFLRNINENFAAHHQNMFSVNSYETLFSGLVLVLNVVYLSLLDSIFYALIWKSDLLSRAG